MPWSITGNIRGPQGIQGPKGDPGPASAGRLVLELIGGGDIVTATNAALTGTEYLIPRLRVQVDLTPFTEVRGSCVVTTAGALASVLRWQFSTDSGTNWQSFQGTLGQIEVDITSTGMKTSVWGAMVAAAKDDILVRFIVVGDGVKDPAVSAVRLMFR